MRYILILVLFLSTHGCSYLPTTDFEYWTEDNIEQRLIKKDYKKKLPRILEKSDDIRSMTIKEYEIYLDAYTEKSKYPDLSK
jgi:hypothetical protein